MRSVLRPCLLSGLLSVLCACGGGGGGSTPPPPPPPPPPTPLTVLSVNPTNNTTGVSVTTNVVFNFSVSLDAATVTASSVELLKNNVLVPTAVSTTGATVTLTPRASLDYSGVYTCVVTTAVKDTSGTPLATQFMSSFITAAYVDTTPPSVASVNPANNSVDVPIGNSVSVTFSEPIAANTVNANSFQLLLGVAQVSMNASLDTTGKVVTIVPAAPLAYASAYSVVVATSVTDLAGNALAAKFTSSFMTAVAPPPVQLPFTLDTQYLMDSVTTDEVGTVFVSGHTTATPTNLFVAKFDATGKLMVLNSNVGLASGFYPYGKIYVHGGSCFVPVTNGTAQATAIAKMSADTLTLLLFAMESSASKPAMVSDNTGHYFIASWGETDKTNIYFASSSFSDTSYTGGTAITLVPNGVVTAGKTNTAVSLTFRDANFVTKWNEVSTTSGYDARSVSYTTSASMLFVSGSTFDASVASSLHFPFVKGYAYQSTDPQNALTLAWTTLLAGTDMADATGAQDGSQYAICTGPDALTKVRANGTLAWSTSLSKKSYGVAEYNGAVYVVDASSAVRVFDGLTGLPR